MLSIILFAGYLLCVIGFAFSFWLMAKSISDLLKILF